jgi:hypothetical protein
MFSEAVRSRAFVASNGEMAWPRHGLPQVFAELVAAERALLGGEAWLVVGQRIIAVLPCKSGPDGVFAWSCDLQPGDGWASFVSRSSEEGRAAVQSLDVESQVVSPPDGAVLYNLTWVTRSEFARLSGAA